MNIGDELLFSFSGSGPLLPAFRPSQDAGGDICYSPCLGLGDVFCSPSLGLGLYYLLSGLRRMLGEMCAVLLVWVWASTTCFQAFAGCWGRCMLFSLSGSILPAFRPCWMSRGTSAVFLSVHQSSQWLPSGSFNLDCLVPIFS